MNILDNFLVHYLRRFDRDCFTVRLHDKTYTIGEGQPLFNIVINKDIPKKELLASTSLALGEAYMRKDVEIEGDLFTALRCLLSQNNQFSLDKSFFKRSIRRNRRALRSSKFRRTMIWATTSMPNGSTRP